VHLVGFIIKKFVTMHGHMNVKKNKNLQTRLTFVCSVSYVWAIVTNINHLIKVFTFS
jgi:hypothetical protein